MDYISGSSGFIGSHLQKRIKGTPILHEKLNSIKLKPFDRFFFLSAYGNMATHKKDLDIYQANVIDLVRILSQATKYPFKSFVYMSTSSVKLRKQTMYSRSKRAAEEILLSFMEKHNRPICIIRPFSVTGVGEQKAHLIPQLIESCMTGKLINFVPSPTHDFIDVEDLVEGVINLSNNSARGIFELGTGKSYTNQQVLEIVEKVTGKKANINIVPSMRPYDNDNWISLNFRSRGFGWLPKKTLEQSIVEMVEAYEQTTQKDTGDIL